MESLEKMLHEWTWTTSSQCSWNTHLVWLLKSFGKQCDNTFPRQCSSRITMPSLGNIFRWHEYHMIPHFEYSFYTDFNLLKRILSFLKLSTLEWPFEWPLRNTDTISTYICWRLEFELGLVFTMHEHSILSWKKPAANPPATKINLLYLWCTWWEDVCKEKDYKLNNRMSLGSHKRHLFVIAHPLSIFSLFDCVLPLW